MATIAVLGSVNLDVVANVHELPRAGQTITGATLSRFPGGKGANQALAARRLGADVTLVARVGSDAEADEALALLRAAGVDLSRVTACEELPTGLALIAVDASGENQIIVAPGANASLAPEELPKADALVCQLEVPPDTITWAARKFDGFLCVNLAPARPVSDAVFENADLVIVNETEAEWYGPALHKCDGLLARSLGAAGAELWQGGERVAHCRAPTVDVVDTTAAGDSFVAALTVSLVEGNPPQQSLEFAVAAGAAAVTKAGAQPSLPDRAEVTALL
jgi:ribokinase